MDSLILRRLKLGSAAGVGCSRIFRSPNSNSYNCGSKLSCIFGSVNSCSNSSNCRCKLGGARMMGTMTSVADESPSLSLLTPYLMLLPTFEGGDMLYNFYSLAEKVVRSSSEEEKLQESEKVPLPWQADININDIKFVGSSHGWLTLFNQRNYDLFLINPLSGRYIKLPPIDKLPEPEFNLRYRRRNRIVSKVIVSCSPDDDEEECHAMMSFGPANRLAFCCPGRSTEWTPMGDLFFKWELPDLRYARFYEDFMYCSRHKLFTCITQLEIDIENWDIFCHSEVLALFI